MKTNDLVMINSGIYEGFKATITGFEHFEGEGMNEKVVINDDPNIMDHGRVELKLPCILANADLVTDNKLYFPVRDFDLI